MKKNNKKSITSLIILSILLIVSLFGLYYYFDLNQMNLNKIFKNQLKMSRKFGYEEHNNI